MQQEVDTDLEVLVEEIQRHFEESRGYQFSLAFKRSKYLYLEDIAAEDKGIEDVMVWFEPNENGFEWAKQYKIELIKDTRDKDIYSFTCDLQVRGKFCYAIGFQEKKIDKNLSITMRVYRYPDIHLINPDHIELWTKEQRVLQELNKVVIDNYKQFQFTPLASDKETDYSVFTSVWNKTANGNKTQQHVSSYYYYHEINHAYEQVMYLITMLNIYKRYGSDYTENEQPVQDGILYMPNWKLYDRRYLSYCSFAFEKLYTYWERLAFLVFQFVKPQNISSPLYLSFTKLVVGIKKDLSSGLHAHFNTPTSNFNWFSNFEANEHKNLREYRHPLIHYKDQNDIYKGSFFSGTDAHWLKNLSNKEEIEKLQEENEKLGTFLTEQFNFCKVGFKKTVDLINEIP